MHSSPTSTFNEKSWHGDSLLFNNRMNAFYSDTSYNKYSKNKATQKQALESIEEKYNQLEVQSNIKYSASVNRQTAEKWNSIKRNALLNHNQLNLLSENAALKIQKVVRGFLSRIKYESQIVEIRELRTKFLLQESERISNTCLFSLGLVTEVAANKLQKSLKRFLLRLKLRRIIKYYQAFLENKSKFASDQIRRFVLIHACKQRVQDIVFLIYREKRLAEIRKNLSILSVKRF